MIRKYNIRFNKSRGEPGRGTEQHVWRVFGDGREYIVKHVDLQVPSHGELDENGADWNITCEACLRIDQDSSTAIFYNPDTQTAPSVPSKDLNIQIYDDLLSHKVRDRLLQLALKSNYRLGWGDAFAPERKAHDVFLHAMPSEQELRDLGFFDDLRGTELGRELENYDINAIVINLSTPSDVYYSHTHSEDKVLLYYVNLEWKQNFHGETLFFNENGRDIELCLPYTPGRLVMFDATTPHSLRPPSFIATHFRFTMALCLNKKRS